MEQLTDGFGRVHRDLRISVTDRCNLRCTYCMPPEGLRWLDRADLLTFEEITRIAAVAVGEFGIGSIRLTGGEPTVRADLDQLVASLSSLDVDLSLTTNGTRLSALAAPLVEAGLRRVNLSIDSLRPERFAELTHRDELDAVLAGLDAAQRVGLDPVKVNCVVMRGVNDDELVDFARFGRERGVVVRFIEFMPLDAQGDWNAGAVVSQREIVERVGAVFPLEAVGRGDEPAERFRFVDGVGEIGVIPSVTEPFCGNCDRIRLTADGRLRNCLFAVEETDLRAVLRSGGTDADLADEMRSCVAGKWAGHAIGRVEFIRPPRSMSQIGG